MSTRNLAISLAKNINRYVILYFSLIMFLSFIFVLLTLLESKNLFFVVIVATVAFIGLGLAVGKAMKRRLEILIQNSLEKIETQLYFDELTGLYNRKTGFERLNEEILRARRTGNPLVVALVDIDDFKRINDTYGHPIGDRALNHVATQLKQALRAYDIVARYGGEEFLVILPNTDEINGYLALDRARTVISKRPVKIGSKSLSITVSIGLWEISGIENPLEAIERADRALYQAKRGGKNRVEVYTVECRSRFN